MTSSSLGQEREGYQKTASPFPYLGLVPVLLLLALVFSLWLFPPALVVFEPHYLLPLFNSSLFLAAGVIAYIAWRSYLISGAATILWLGCGVLTLGAGALAAGWLIFPFGPNVNVTIFNVTVLLAAICHAGGVLSTLEERPGEADPGRRRRKATFSFLAALTAIILLVGLTLAGIMPPFFIQGKGPTILRQYVVEWALVLLLFAALVIMQRFLRKRASFLYWYSLALALMAIAMLAFFLQPAVGSPIGWVGRTSYVFAAVYFLLSANAALREARTRGKGLSEALAELFGPGLHWQGILATVSDAVVSYDDNGEILLWNRAAERIFGYPEGEVQGQDIDLILPDLEAIEASALAGEITEMELTRQDGAGFSAEVSASSMRSAWGVIKTLVIRDVTARQRAEAALRESEALLRTIFDNLTEGVVVSTMDGQLFNWNRAALEMHGYASLEESHHQFAEVTETFELATMDGAVLPIEQWPLPRILRGEELRELELHVRRKDKKLERIFNYSGALVREHEGIPLLAIVRVADVTERKRAEEALRESEEHYHSLFDHMLEGFAYCRMHYEHDRPADFTYLNVNGAFEALTGLKNVVGKKVSEVIPGIRESDPELFEIYGRVASTGEPERFETFLEGLGMWFAISVYSPRKEYFVAVFDVITERKRAEEALRRLNAELEQRVEARTEELKSTVVQLGEEIIDRQQAELEITKLNEELEQRVQDRTADLEFANRELEAFTYSVSHDLKAPLRAIQGFSAILAAEHAAGLDQEGLRLLQVIRDNTHKMGQLIGNLLDLSRVGRREMRAQSLELGTLAAAIFRELQDQNPGRQLRLQLEPLPAARGDRSLMHQVLFNLMANAVKFSRGREVGEIEVGGRSGGAENIFYVKDNGVGFDMRYAEKLFVVFQTLHNRQEFEGTGVGLAIVQRIIQRHGGRVWAEGQVGGGATFYFSLPNRGAAGIEP